MEDHAEADLQAHSAQSDATGREREAREAAEESAVELRGLLASLRGEKDAVTQVTMGCGTVELSRGVGVRK